MSEKSKKLIYECTLVKFQRMIEYTESLEKKIEEHKTEIANLKKMLYSASETPIENQSI